MKYKVGDRVRLKDGHLIYLGEQYYTDSFMVKNHINKMFITSSEISHLIISEITDELINRFKEEKIAWHFKSKEDYEKALDILYSKYLTFSHRRYEFEYDCIHYDEHSLYRENFKYCKSEGYEIIEIMKPVYVPINIKIDDEWIDIDVIRYVENNLGTQYKDYKKQYYYKNQNVEVMFQGYQTMQFFEKKFKEQQDDINTLHYRLDCAKYERERYLKENNDLKQMIKNQQFVIQSHREKLGTIRDVLDED